MIARSSVQDGSTSRSASRAPRAIAAVCAAATALLSARGAAAQGEAPPEAAPDARGGVPAGPIFAEPPALGDGWLRALTRAIGAMRRLAGFRGADIVVDDGARAADPSVLWRGDLVGPRAGGETEALVLVSGPVEVRAEPLYTAPVIAAEPRVQHAVLLGMRVAVP